MSITPLESKSVPLLPQSSHQADHSSSGTFHAFLERKNRFEEAAEQAAANQYKRAIPYSTMWKSTTELVERPSDVERRASTSSSSPYYVDSSTPSPPREKPHSTQPTFSYPGTDPSLVELERFINSYIEGMRAGLIEAVKKWHASSAPTPKSFGLTPKPSASLESRSVEEMPTARVAEDFLRILGRYFHVTVVLSPRMQKLVQEGYYIRLLVKISQRNHEVCSYWDAQFKREKEVVFLNPINGNNDDFIAFTPHVFFPSHLRNPRLRFKQKTFQISHCPILNTIQFGEKDFSS